MKNSFGALLLMQVTQLVHLFMIDGSDIGSLVKGAEDRVYYCPPKFLRLGSSCYYISPEMASWRDAHYRCRSMSKGKPATLAVLDNKWEDRTIKAFLNHPDITPVDRWVGGTFNWMLKQWMWGPTGTKVHYNKKFTQRAKRKNKDYSWHCIVMNARRKYNWKAEKCLRKKHYICETKLEVRKDPKIHMEYKLQKNEILE